MDAVIAAVRGGLQTLMSLYLTAIQESPNSSFIESLNRIS